MFPCVCVQTVAGKWAICNRCESCRRPLPDDVKYHYSTNKNDPSGDGTTGVAASGGKTRGNKGGALRAGAEPEVLRGGAVSSTTSCITLAEFVLQVCITTGDPTTLFSILCHTKVYLIYTS